jgi:hypothetical protein
MSLAGEAGVMSADLSEHVQQLIGRWRAYVLEHGASEEHVATLEGRLRDHTAGLGDAGLDEDEAFLVALRRVAVSDDATQDFARAYSEESWRAPAGSGPEPAPRHGADEFAVMLGCAIAAGLAIQLPRLFGFGHIGGQGSFYARNLSLFVLPFLTVYFSWKRGLRPKTVAGLAAVFVAAVVFADAYPFAHNGATEVLTAIHLPIALWFTSGVAYVAGEWRSDERRLEFVRFTGEWLVTYALIALGGGVLVVLTTGVFSAIGLDAGLFISEWVLPSGAMGAVIVAAWLVMTRRNLVGGMAPMLARVFTPLFAATLVALLAAVVWTRGVIDIQREVLLLFDVLLVVVLALLLYAISARDREQGPGLFDRIQLVLVGCALAVDVVALVNIAGRLTTYGFSANRTAVIGLNLVLLAGLAWSALRQTGFLRSRLRFEAVERAHMRYLPVYAVWAAIVVVAFPLVFGFA